jgi:outer membrane protein OmpA-like peptidoglycan-associated protein
LLLIAALWWFNRAKAPEVPAVANLFKLNLPDGTVLNVPENGIENQLVKFITDSSRPVDDTTWFNFDRLLFDTGSATLQPASQEQLNNIAAILKAYPNVHVKIGGYTDNVGDAAANLNLSKARAQSVMNAIVAAGIDPSRLEAQGYGEDHPVADNSTPEGRAQNRRIALRVTAK